MDGAHDLGGMHGFGHVMVEGGRKVFREAWEARVFAMYKLCEPPRHSPGANDRPQRESMTPGDYLRSTYFERWMWCMQRQLETDGRLAIGAVEERLHQLGGGHAVIGDRSLPFPSPADISATASPPTPEPGTRYSAGDRVRVRRMHRRGHTRCPRYIRGVAGTVERVHKPELLPDLAAYGLPTEPQGVYAVAFSSHDIWGPSDEPAWTVVVDLFDDYLEPG